MARGAVVVVFSDGWERGDPGLLAEQMARLHRIAHRVIWVNPHRGKAGYEPIQGGVQAVLPHVDDFVAGHSLAAFAEVLGADRERLTFRGFSGRWRLVCGRPESGVTVRRMATDDDRQSLGITNDRR